MEIIVEDNTKYGNAFQRVRISFGIALEGHSRLEVKG